MSWLSDLISSGGALAGALTAIGGLFAGLVVWLNKRMRKAADEAFAAKGIATTVGRLEHLEQKVDGLTKGVGELGHKQEAMDSRMVTIERTMDGLATREGVAGLQAELHEFRGRTEEALQGTRRQVDRLYDAAIAQSKEGS
ncbi:MAG: hypothetical protein AAF618_00835 [Pseudomonadota bacterium]